MCSDVYELIWFKFCLIDTTKVYMLILVQWAWPWFKTTWEWEIKKSLQQLCHKVLSCLKWNLVCCWELLVWWIYSLDLFWSEFRWGLLRLFFRQTHKMTVLCRHAFRHLWMDFFQTFVYQYSTSWHQLEWLWPSFKVTVIWLQSVAQTFILIFLPSFLTI